MGDTQIAPITSSHAQRALSEGDGMPVVSPVVSVAIITYNQEDYIEECLASVVAQTYRPLEIVVADDGSTDRTRDIIMRYATEHPGLIVPVFATANGGVTANSTAAHYACTGSYIAWLGGDDIMAPEKIARQVKVMEQSPEVALCYHDLDVFDSESGLTLRRFSDLNRPREGGVSIAIRYGTFNGGSATMIRRDRAPNGYDPRIPVASDWLYWIECLRDGGRIAYVDAVLGRYRRHPRNVTAESAATRQLLLDHLITCAIVLVAMPQYTAEVSHSAARLLVGIARRNKTGRYRMMMLAAAVVAASAMIGAIGLFTKSKDRRHG